MWNFRYQQAYKEGFHFTSGPFRPLKLHYMSNDYLILCIRKILNGFSILLKLDKILSTHSANISYSYLFNIMGEMSQIFFNNFITLLVLISRLY
jgi:hypothetical protein